MIYKKIRGANPGQLHMEVRSQFGKDAIILNTREVPEEGWLGSKIFSRRQKLYEMEFMIPELSEKRPAPGPRQQAGRSEPQGHFEPQGFDVSEEEIQALIQSYSADSGEKRISREAAHSEQLMEVEASPLFTQDFNDSTRAPAPPPQSAGPAGFDKNLQNIQSRLGGAHFGSEFIQDFMRELDLSLSRLDVREMRKVEEKSRERMEQKIRTVPDIAPVSGECRAVMFIGPTGSGKTTTLVKVAARYHFFKRREVSFYSLDNVRLAATEQLKTYAAIMDAPFYAPLDEKEFTQTTEKDGAELLLIDTPGSSYQDSEKLERILSYAEACQVRLEKHLVLAANTSPYLLEKILMAYEVIGFDKIILTKLDEADFIGAFIELADKFSRPFSFLTNGQDVPGSILEAEPGMLADMVLKRS